MQPSFLDLDVRPKPPTPFVVERVRRENNETRVLERLRQGPATTMELVALAGVRATGRIWELRQKKYLIEAEHCGGGLWRYRLVSEP